ncbi:unnamed protein product, partial [Darwinula stevensoni]
CVDSTRNDSIGNIEHFCSMPEMPLLVSRNPIRERSLEMTPVSIALQMYDEDKGTDRSKLPVPEPGDVDRAATLNFSTVHAQIEELNASLQDLQEKANVVIMGEGSSAKVIPFKHNMQRFFDGAETKLADIRTLEVDALASLEAAYSYFQWRPKADSKTPSEDFFTLWAPFVKDFKYLWKKQQAQVTKEKSVHPPVRPRPSLRCVGGGEEDLAAEEAVSARKARPEEDLWARGHHQDQGIRS